MPMVVYTEEEVMDACNEAVAKEARQIAEARDKFYAALRDMVRVYEGKWSDEPPELIAARELLS